MRLVGQSPKKNQRKVFLGTKVFSFLPQKSPIPSCSAA